jgi:hypothetical protein
MGFFNTDPPRRAHVLPESKLRETNGSYVSDFAFNCF